MRTELIQVSKRGKISQLQSLATPILKPNNRIYYVLRYVDKEQGNKEILEWSIGIEITVSNSNNLFYSYRSHRKDSTVEVKWDYNESIRENTNTSIVKNEKLVCNSHAEYSFYIILNTE